MADDIVAPQFEGVAKRKLDDLLARGWQISGYSITKDGEHGLVTTGSFVGWWTVAANNASKAEREVESLRARVAVLEGALSEQAKYAEIDVSGVEHFFDFWHDDETPAVRSLALKLAVDRGGGTCPVSDYDVKNAKRIITGRTDEIDALKTKSSRYRDALIKISSPTQSTGLLWWQIEARRALTPVAETPNQDGKI